MFAGCGGLSEGFHQVEIDMLFSLRFSNYFHEEIEIFLIIFTIVKLLEWLIKENWSDRLQNDTLGDIFMGYEIRGFRATKIQAAMIKSPKSIIP